MSGHTLRTPLTLSALCVLIASANVCLDLGDSNKNFDQCDNYHVYGLFLMDPDTRRDAFLPITQMLIDILYSCATQDKNRPDAAEQFAPNQFTYLSAQYSWSCNVSNCDFYSSLSLDVSKYPASSDANLFTIIDEALHDNGLLTNKAKVLFIFSNIKTEDFKYIIRCSKSARSWCQNCQLQNCSSAIMVYSKTQRKGRSIQGNEVDTFYELQQFSGNSFRDVRLPYLSQLVQFIIPSTKDFSRIIDEVYVCPVNGTYITTTSPTVGQTTSSPKKSKKIFWILPLCLCLFVAFCVGLFLILRWKFCAHWKPKISILQRGTANSIGTREMSPEMRSATILSTASLMGISAIVTRSQTFSSRAASTDPWMVSADRVFLTAKKIGSGVSSEVVRAILKGRPPVKDCGIPFLLSLQFNDDSNEVAAKFLKPSASMEAKAAFVTEAELLKQIGFHAHVVQLIGVVSEGAERLLLTQLCPLGDLGAFLREKANGAEELSLRERRMIAWQICDALCFLASKMFVHRDIAARNVFLLERTQAKLGDFGLCVQAADGSIRAGGHLPLRSMPPEAIEHLMFCERTDVYGHQQLSTLALFRWSFGVLLWELYSDGAVPFADVPLGEMLQHLQDGHRPPAPDKCPASIVDIQTKCWQLEPQQRPRFTEIRKLLFDFIDCNSTQYGYIDFKDYK